MTTIRQHFHAWAQDGLLGHAVPANQGGAGDGFAQLVESHEQLGRESRDSGLILALNAHLWGSLFPMLIHGSAAQRQRFLPGLLDGTLIGGQAITEAQAGSDLQGLRASAVAVDDGFVLTGHKRTITNAPDANLLVVYTRLNEKLSAFIVTRDDPGSAFLDHPAVDACASAGMGDVLLEQCRVPAERLLGKSGNGLLMVQRALELERAFIFAGICGILDRLLGDVIEFSRKRTVAGHALASHQAISHRIAEMRTRLDTTRLWVKNCAMLKDAGKGITLASSQTKLVGAEAFLQISLDAVQIFGAAGLMEDHPARQLVGDALASRLFSGTSEIQKNIIAAILGVVARN
ncbi:MAG: acyl-CoA dehydrogenase family protein [Methylococcales bacterium]